MEHRTQLLASKSSQGWQLAILMRILVTLQLSGMSNAESSLRSLQALNNNLRSTLNPVDLHFHDDIQQQQQPWWLNFIAAFLLFGVISFFYSYVMAMVESVTERNEALNDELTKLTIIVPHAGSSSGGTGSTDSGGSSSDESACLLSSSVKGWNYYDCGMQYRSIDSDLSDHSGDWDEQEEGDEEEENE